MPEPLRLTFLGCGFITRVLHSQHLRKVGEFTCAYASIRSGRAPEMSLERAMDDQQLMDRIYAGIHEPG